MVFWAWVLFCTPCWSAQEFQSLEPTLNRWSLYIIWTSKEFFYCFVTITRTFNFKCYKINHLIFEYIIWCQKLVHVRERPWSCRREWDQGRRCRRRNYVDRSEGERDKDCSQVSVCMSYLQYLPSQLPSSLPSSSSSSSFSLLKRLKLKDVSGYISRRVHIYVYLGVKSYYYAETFFYFGDFDTLNLLI